MALRFTIPDDVAAGMLRERIGQHFLGHPVLRSGNGKYNVLPDKLEARAVPLADLAYRHFAPKLLTGAPALKTSLRAMAKDDSSLIKAVADHLESHRPDYAYNCYSHLRDGENRHLGYTAKPMATRLVKELCRELEGSMFVNDVKAAPVTAITPQAKELAAKLAARDAARAA